MKTMNTKTEIMVEVFGFNADTFRENYRAYIIGEKTDDYDNAIFTMLVDADLLAEIKGLTEECINIISMPAVMITADNSCRLKLNDVGDTMTLGDLAKRIADLAARVGDAAPVFVRFDNREQYHELTDDYINIDYIDNFN